jgi:hypothetical protein
LDKTDIKINNKWEAFIKRTAHACKLDPSSSKYQTMKLCYFAGLYDMFNFLLYEVTAIEDDNLCETILTNVENEMLDFFTSTLDLPKRYTNQKEQKEKNNE